MISVWKNPQIEIGVPNAMNAKHRRNTTCMINASHIPSIGNPGIIHTAYLAQGGQEAT